MVVSAVQEERGPRRGIRLKSSSSSKSLKSSKQMASDSSSNQMLIQILLTCLRQVQSNECFNHISKLQRNVIIRHVWSELFVLKVSHWPIDITSAFDSHECLDLTDIISAMKALNADLMELSLLEILILSRPELAVDNEERVLLQRSMENALARLALYVSTSTTSHHQQHHKLVKNCIAINNDKAAATAAIEEEVEISRGASSIMRFGKLLLALRHLSVRSLESSLNNLFSDIIDINFHL